MRISLEDIKSESVAVEALVWEVVNISTAKHFGQAHYSSSRDNYNLVRDFVQGRFDIDVTPYDRVVDKILARSSKIPLDTESLLKGDY